MILIDLGNTRLKWQARSSKGEIQARGAGCHEHGMRLTELAAELGREVQDRGPVSVASVAGDVLEGMLTRVLERLGFAPAGIMFVKAESARAGVRSGYRDPARLGADRWAALIGTWAKHHRASLILSLGTAITLDVLDDEGVHRGGAHRTGARRSCACVGLGHRAVARGDDSRRAIFGERYRIGSCKWEPVHDRWFCGGVRCVCHPPSGH